MLSYNGDGSPGDPPGASGIPWPLCNHKQTHAVPLACSGCDAGLSHTTRQATGPDEERAEDGGYSERMGEEGEDGCGLYINSRDTDCCPHY